MLQAMKAIPVLGSFGAEGLVRSRSSLSFPRKPFLVTVADGSLRVLSILPGDALVCAEQPFYDDGCLVFCRTVGTQTDPLQSWVPADAAYFIGRYRQITDLVTILLPCGRVLAGDVLVLAAVSYVVRLYE